MISIIIPTYNEKDNIIDLILEIKKCLLEAHLENEIIIIDDNSPDGTGKTIRRVFDKDKNIRLFVRKNNRGLGTAILYGINKSKGSIIVGMDADFNHPPNKICKLIDKLNNSDLVVASRFVKGGGMEQKFKYITSYIFNFFLRYALGFPIMDNTSGFYAIKKKNLLKLPSNEIYYGYGEYHLRLTYLANKFHLSILEIPVFFPKRRQGNSKSNLISMIISYIQEAIKITNKFVIINYNEKSNTTFSTKLRQS